MTHRLGRPALALSCLLAFGASALAQQNQLASLRRLNQDLAGRVLDFTHNHRGDCRRCSLLLQAPRDLYVYLPPGHDPSQQYALLVYVHGGFGDEHGVLDTGQIRFLDCLIQRGCCPPLVAVFPDASCSGRNLLTSKHTFLVNGCCGPFEDYIMQEIVPWAMRCFSISPDRQRHAIGGISAGGMAAMRMALKHREFFGHVYSIAGPLNLRYQTCSGDYFADFNPATYLPRTSWDPKAVIGKLGPLKFRAASFIEPVFGSGPDLLQRITAENPADLLASMVPEDQPHMLVAYGLQDGFNFDAHGASFVFLAQRQGLEVAVDIDPQGNHSADYFNPAHQRAYRWLAQGLSAASWQADGAAHAFLGSPGP